MRAIAVIASLSFGSVLGVVRPASAQGDRGDARAIRWSVSAQPDGCDVRRLARATALACDALGHACVIVSDGGPSDRRATLRCGPGAPWTLDVYDGAGVLRWTLAVEADDEGVHRAAILLARTELDIPPEAAAAPPPAPPIAASPPVLVAPPDAVAPPPATVDRPTPPPPAPAPWGLFAAARATTGSGFGPAVGGSAGAAFVVWRALAIGFDLGGEHGLSVPSDYGYSAVRAAANVSYGAPWGPQRFGVALEGGAVLGDVTAPASTSPASQQFLHAYGRAAAIVQWERDDRHALRPYAALSVLANTAPVYVTSAGADVAQIPWLAASIDVGLAWRSQ